MRGIERVVAALLLAGAVAGAAAFPLLLRTGAPSGPLAVGAPAPMVTVVQAAPAPARRLPRAPAGIRAVAPLRHTQPALPALRPQIAHPLPAPAPAPAAPAAPAPTPAPAPAPAPAPPVAAPAPVPVPPPPAATPLPPAIVIPLPGHAGDGEHGNGRKRGHDGGDQGAPRIIASVQPPGADASAPEDGGSATMQPWPASDGSAPGHSGWHSQHGTSGDG